MDNMYAYSVGYGSYEDSRFYMCFHASKMTREELQVHVEACLVELAVQIYERVKNKEEMEWPYSRELWSLSFSDFVNEDFTALMEKRGFIFPEYEACYSVSGWAKVYMDKRGQTKTNFADEEEMELRRKIDEACPEAKFLCSKQEENYKRRKRRMLAKHRKEEAKKAKAEDATGEGI